MAGELGTLIEPYRVAPTNGGTPAIFAQQQELLAKMQSDAALAQATREYLAQQMGLPQGVDPGVVQTYQGEGQRQAFLGKQEGRAAQDHQEKYDYASGFLLNLPQQTNPTLAAMQAGGGVFGAQALTETLGGQFGRQGERQNRAQINDADNAAAQKRVEFELSAREKSDVAKEARGATKEKELQTQVSEATQKFMQGDPSGLINFDPKLAGNPEFMQQAWANQNKVASLEKERKLAEWEALNPPGGDRSTRPAQNDPRVLQATIDKQYPNSAPQRTVDQTIQATKEFGGSPVWQAVREMYPDLYNQAWKADQQKIKENQVLQMIENIKNPRANSTTRTGGF